MRLLQQHKPKTLSDAFPGQASASAVIPDTVHNAGTISARLDRLPATRSVWKLVALLALGYFFEL